MSVFYKKDVYNSIIIQSVVIISENVDEVTGELITNIKDKNTYKEILDPTVAWRKFQSVEKAFEFMESNGFNVAQLVMIGQGDNTQAEIYKVKDLYFWMQSRCKNIGNEYYSLSDVQTIVELFGYKFV